jgi:hypothetical protein
MVIIPKHMIGKTIYPAYGKILLCNEMTKEEVLEASKIYPEIRWKEEEPKKSKKLEE